MLVVLAAWVWFGGMLGGVRRSACIPANLIVCSENTDDTSSAARRKWNVITTEHARDFIANKYPDYIERYDSLPSSADRHRLAAWILAHYHGGVVWLGSEQPEWTQLQAARPMDGITTFCASPSWNLFGAAHLDHGITEVLLHERDRFGPLTEGSFWNALRKQRHNGKTKFQ